ncbi:hypothetical protein ABC955_00320 [Citromicrobium bathyomarinum]
MAELCGFREVAASQSKMIGHSDLIKLAVFCGFSANHFQFTFLNNARSRNCRTLSMFADKGAEMAINWFEGGRRISKLCMGIVVAVGAATVLWRNDPDPVLSSRGPTMPWFVSPDSCPENAYVRYLWDYDWGGNDPGLRLCFLPLPNGSIPYAVAPTPPDELEREAQDKRDNEMRMANGEPPKLTIQSPWFYGAPEYDERVQSYVSGSISNLRITPELATRLRDSMSTVRWNDRKKAFNEALPWVAGICGFLWAFTFAMGWIIRGFAGIPTGQDFKPSKQKD